MQAEWLTAILPLIEKLGVVGILVSLCAYFLYRYDRVAATAEKRIQEINDKRVEDAKSGAIAQENYLKLAAEMMGHMAQATTAVRQTADSLDAVSRRLEDSDRLGRRAR
jgi:hypothetical protein